MTQQLSLEKLAQLAIEIALCPTVRFEGVWYDRQEVHQEIDKRVRYGLVVKLNS